MKLHKRQVDILNILKENYNSPLKVIELSQKANIVSPGVLYHHLSQLEKKGYLKRNPKNSKDYIVLDSPEKTFFYVPKYRLRKSCESIFDFSPIAQVPFSTQMIKFPATGAFIIESQDSFMHPRIEDGDVLIVQKQPKAISGEIIVCIHNKQPKIRQYIVMGQKKVLFAINEKHNSYIYIEETDSFTIEGVVRSFIRTI
ncbi:MAG TPA: S24 family peptidase [Flavobacterium sp.]|nr:S24 family peptidase [Flavobacterium sp.]